MLKRLLIVFLTVAIAFSAMAAGKVETSETATVKPAGDYQFPWTGDPMTLTYFCVDFSYAGMERGENKLIDATLQKLMGNVKIDDQSVGWADYGTRTDLFFASGELPDILVQWPGYATRFADSGYMLDFAKYLDYMPNYRKLHAKYPRTFMYVGDSIYAIQQPRDITIISREWCANGWYVDQGVPIPKTYEEVYTSCKMAKEINPDCYPLFFNWGGQFLEDFNTNQGVFWNNDTQKWEWGLVSENYKSYITFISKMYVEGLMHPNQYEPVWGDQWLSTATDPYAWFLYSGYHEINQLQMPKLLTKEPSFSIKGMLPPLAPNNNHIWIPIEAAPGTDTWHIYASAKTANPEFLTSFLDYMINDDIGVLVNWGIEGETFGVKPDGTKYYLDDKITYLANSDYPSSGKVDAIKELSLFSHFMCKQYATVTGNDFIAMNTFHRPADAPQVLRTEIPYAEHIAANPSHARWRPPIPTLTPAESKLVSSLMTDIDTYASEQIALFQTGRRDISEWDEFIDEVMKIGDGQIVADLYNEKPPTVLVNN